jgi:hypothetical protein
MSAHPPPAKKSGRHAGNAAAQKTDSDGSGCTERSDHPLDFQGVANRRSPKQRAPRWRKPAGYDALADLERLYGAPSRPFVRKRP